MATRARALACLHSRGAPGKTGSDRSAARRETRVAADGRVYLTPSPKDVIVFVCGGTGSLHAHGVHSWGTCLSVTKPVV